MTVDVESAVVNANVHDGFSFLTTAFDAEPTREIAVIECSDSLTTSVIEQSAATPVRAWSTRLRGVLSRVRSAVVEVVGCVRSALSWLASGSIRSAERRRYVARHAKVMPIRHGVLRTLTGRARSTSEYSRAVQRRSREPLDAEGELVFKPGDTFVNWVTAAIESMQTLEYARHHEPAHGRWMCS